MNALGARIADLIGAQGPITVAQYMTLAMHDRRSGYYATRDPFGAEGDFVTAPEISQMFGELVGLWCIQTWIDQNRPAKIRFVELGPGRGTLMRDALRAARVAPEFLSSIEVVLVESNPVLRKVQETALREVHVPLCWTETCDEGLFDRPTYLIANEFFDALPIRQLVRGENGWRERMIATDAAGALSFVLSPVNADALVAPSRGGAPEGGVYEYSDSATALVEEVARGIAKRGGAALIVDYGYGEPDFGETLQAVLNHQPANPLEAPGEADISASVDFGALKSAAESHGVKVGGPIEQGQFLVDLGILERANVLRRSAHGGGVSIDDDVRRLIEDDKMGQLFKVLALVPANAPAPPGF